MHRSGWSKSIARGAGLVALVFAAVVALTAQLVATADASELASSTAPAVTCTDSWANASGGAWMTGSNWSTGRPPTSSQNACITLDGTYTVQLFGAAVTVHSLTLGGTTGTQLLQIGDVCGTDGSLTVTSASTIGGLAQVELTDGSTCNGNATLAGSFTNSGTVTTSPGAGGARHLQGVLTNSSGALVQINATTSLDGSSPNLKNSGTVSIADGTTLNVPTGATFTHTAGTISTSGSSTTGYVLVNGGTFTESAGTTSGTLPVVVDDGTLSYAGSGASSIGLEGASTVNGKIAAGQSLTIQSTCAENAVATGASTFTSNAGTLTLTNGDTCGNNVTLALSGQTITNTGTLTVQPGVGGARTFQGNLTNPGTIQVNSATTFNGAGTTLDNTGTVTILNGITLDILNGASFNNDTKGLITAVGSGQLDQTGGTFTQGGGLTVGTEPVVLDDLTLNYTGTGDSQLWLEGTSTLEGASANTQQLTIQSTCAENAVVTTAGSFTNGAAVVLTNGDSCAGDVSLTIPTGGTWTNAAGGAMTTLPGVGGMRTFAGNVVNETGAGINNSNGGFLVFNANTTDNAAGTSIDNHGSILIGNGMTFSVTGGASVLNDTNGKITATGTGGPLGTGQLVVQNGTFTLGAGSDKGAEPVVVDDGTLAITGAGTGIYGLRGTSTLTGNVVVGQIISVESTCAENASATDPSSLTSGGTIILTNSDSCPNNVTLTVKTGTLTNHATLETVAGAGGTRVINASVSNQSLLIVDAGSPLQVNKFSQNSAGTLQSNLDSATSFGVLKVNGSAALAGVVAPVLGHAFAPTAGTNFPILSATSVKNTFATELNGGIKNQGLYLLPTYSTTGVSLNTTQATMTLTPNTGAPGAVVTVAGSSWAPNDSLTVTFTDANGVMTTYPKVTASSTGAFSTNVTVPSTAAIGNGSVTVTSSITGATFFLAFNVT